MHLACIRTHIFPQTSPKLQPSGSVHDSAGRSWTTTVNLNLKPEQCENTTEYEYLTHLQYFVPR